MTSNATFLLYYNRSIIDLEAFQLDGMLAVWVVTIVAIGRGIMILLARHVHELDCVGMLVELMSTT